MKQVFQVFEEQAGNERARFGEIAVVLGYITSDELDELLADQVRHRPPIGELLVDTGALTREQLDAALDDLDVSKTPAGAKT